ARASALGGAYAAVSDDSLATHYNPAGLGRLDRIEAAGGHEARFEGLNYDYAVLAVPVLAWTDKARRVSDYGTAAASVYSLSAGGIERRGAVETDAAAGTFKAADRAYALSYGVTVPATGLALGTSVKLVESSLDTARATALTADVGGLWRRGNWSAGAGIRNAFGRLSLGSSADPLPSVVYGAGSWQPRAEWLAVAEADMPRQDALVVALGLERSRSVAYGVTAAARAGWRSERIDAGGLAGVSFGFGVSWKGLDADFCWTAGGLLGDVMQYSVKARF
ncbi:MAG: hypothetical protein A2V88_02475, partial [Elusimicrobia bacterium RBG_16_66_12]